METFNHTQIAILNTLSDGLWHSGHQLGASIGISRTAIWKQIKRLSDIGVPIQTTAKKGYCLKQPMTLISEQIIHQYLLEFNCPKTINIRCFSSIDSTNRYLKELEQSTCVQLCCAEQQTAGRGRFGRTWYSPFGENIYCSIRWLFSCDLSELSGLSLVVSLTVLSALKDINSQLDVKIKWPNDLLWQGKKLCGSLIEMSAESNGLTDVVIGIGLNVNSLIDETMNFNKPWCSLFEITQKRWDRNLLIARIVSKLCHTLDVFSQAGFSSFLNEWRSVDYLAKQRISVCHPLGSLTGIALGVNKLGQLRLQDDDSNIHILSSGDASLHRS